MGHGGLEPPTSGLRRVRIAEFGTHFGTWFWRAGEWPGILESVSAPLTLTAVFTPDENGWTMAQLAEWPAVVTCGRTVEEARELLLDAAREMLASYRDEGREPPIGAGHAEQITIDLAA